MEKQLTCPTCNTNLCFRLKLPVATTCASCNTTLFISKTQEITFANKKWSNPPDISHLRLFTKGKYKGSDFELIGRIRNISSSSINNEWLMYFNDGSYLWLTENMFVYFVSEVDVTVLKPKEIKIKSAGSSIHIWKQEYTINEISKLLQMEVQGEIPYEAFNDETYFKYELTAVDNSAWATICIYDKDTIEATKFRKIELSDLQLKDVTEFKEWM